MSEARLKTYHYYQAVRAFRVTEELFTDDHPSDLHIDEVVYDPANRTVAVPFVFGEGSTTRVWNVPIGMWVVIDQEDQNTRIMSNQEFRATYIEGESDAS